MDDEAPLPGAGPQSGPPGSQVEHPAPETGAAELEAQLAERNKAHADLENQFKRLAADFENYRRRQNSEREELIKFAASRVLENFLPIVDNFERAIAAAKAENTDKAQVLAGIELIHRQIQDFLSKQGVAEMEAQGKAFDPQLHEAIHQQETTEAPDQTVLNVAQKGYLLNGKVLRHAMVQVASNPHGQGELSQQPQADESGQQKEESNHG